MSIILQGAKRPKSKPSYTKALSSEKPLVNGTRHFKQLTHDVKLINESIKGNKLTSRKTLLKGKTSSLRESNNLRACLNNEPAGLKPQKQVYSRRESFSIKRKTSFINHNWGLRCMQDNKVSIDILDDITKSDVTQDPRDQQTIRKEEKPRRVNSKSINKTLNINNLLECLNNDKQLNNNRQQLRVP